jgi:hypothetical protein
MYTDRREPVLPIQREAPGQKKDRRTTGPSFNKANRSDYGFFVGLGNPPGFVVVAGVLVPEGWAEDLALGLGVVAGRLALSLAITTSLKSMLSLA